MERRRFVEQRICALYPEVSVEERLDAAHNQLNLGVEEPLRLHQAGKQTLVFGELGSAVRFAQESGNACPNYWHFSPYGFCPFGCKYCYLGRHSRRQVLALRQGMLVNLPEMLMEIDRIAWRQQQPTAFYIGKLQDSLALDPLTAYSIALVPFSPGIFSLGSRCLPRAPVSIASCIWSIAGTPSCRGASIRPEVSLVRRERSERDERLEAMRQVAAAGYPVRAIMMPMHPH